MTAGRKRTVAPSLKDRTPVIPGGAMTYLDWVCSSVQLTCYVFRGDTMWMTLIRPLDLPLQNSVGHCLEVNLVANVSSTMAFSVFFGWLSSIRPVALDALWLKECKKLEY